MSIEALAKPLVDALLKALAQAREGRLKRSARKALSEAIQELIKASPDVADVEAKIAVARAAGIIEKDLFVAEKMLKSVKPPAPRKKTPAARVRRKTTSKPRKAR